MKNVEKKTMIIIILSLLLLFAGLFIVYNEYTRMKAARELSVFQQGVKAGSEQTLIYIFQQGSTCKPIPVYINNSTLTMIPVECLFSQAVSCDPIALNYNNRTLNLIARECITNK